MVKKEVTEAGSYSPFSSWTCRVPADSITGWTRDGEKV